MWVCPRCHRETADEQTLCQGCGFDRSCDYTRYPTLCAVPSSVWSAARFGLSGSPGDGDSPAVGRMEADTWFSNGIYGLYVAWLACHYHLIRFVGRDAFVYRNTCLFTPCYNVPDDGGVSPSYIVRGRDGKARLDCSAFVGLVLRGIPYEASPFANHPWAKGAAVFWTPSRELVYGTDWYKTDIYDRMSAGRYVNLGIDGYSSLRTAAQLAEYFYRTGLILFDAETDGDSADYGRDFSSAFLLEPGDLIFWAKSTASPAQKARFRSVSHVAIVEERSIFFVQATTGASVITRLRLNGTLTDRRGRHPYDEITLVVRPDYRFDRSTTVWAPIGVNLCHYPWNFGCPPGNCGHFANGLSYAATACNAAGDDGIRIYGEKSPACRGVPLTVWLRGNPDDGLGMLRLVPGRYRLTGMNGTGIPSTAFALQLRKEDGSEFTPPIRCYDGRSVRFTITQPCKARLCLYIGRSGATDAMDCTIYPHLERTAD